MIHPLDERLREEARRYRLVFACPDCASFDPAETERDEAGGAPAGGAPRCSLGYPVAPHLSPSLGDDRDEIIFCKAFELR
ncbi:hypothetical protein BE04_30445 [Sorangium cellulosum]|uniref:Uncharacterized protein n=2 Tax=Sorangium cellulosum TaxID=56 RepID=A0A150PSN6_SORCE|nr:hypothetical protein [Sorangium cellulosum]AGP40590.1 hypothetical protein SCE1572_42485 [Sorangium cellulosum So0157-2]KYF58680.1 hypothetical protein BE04_30445 [Sorangium cellulosum]